MSNGVIITGTSCAGKTSVSRLMTKADESYVVAKAVTTRKKRDDDVQGDYDYVDINIFNKYKINDELIVSSSYRNDFYGILRSEAVRILNMNRMPIFVITPSSIMEIKSNSKGIRLLTFFLDADDAQLSERYLHRNMRYCDSSFAEQNRKDRLYIKDAEYLIKNDVLELAKKAIMTLHRHHLDYSILYDSGVIKHGNFTNYYEHINANKNHKFSAN